MLLWSSHMLLISLGTCMATSQWSLYHQECKHTYEYDSDLYIWLDKEKWGCSIEVKDMRIWELYVDDWQDEYHHKRYSCKDNTELVLAYEGTFVNVTNCETITNDTSPVYQYRRITLEYFYGTVHLKGFTWTSDSHCIYQDPEDDAIFEEDCAPNHVLIFNSVVIKNRRQLGCWNTGPCPSFKVQETVLTNCHRKQECHLGTSDVGVSCLNRYFKVVFSCVPASAIIEIPGKDVLLPAYGFLVNQGFPKYSTVGPAVCIRSWAAARTVVMTFTDLEPANYFVLRCSETVYFSALPGMGKGCNRLNHTSEIMLTASKFCIADSIRIRLFVEYYTVPVTVPLNPTTSWTTITNTYQPEPEETSDVYNTVTDDSMDEDEVNTTPLAAPTNEQNQADDDQGEDIVLPVVVSMVLVAIILAVIVVAMIIWKKRKRKKGGTLTHETRHANRPLPSIRQDNEYSQTPVGSDPGGYSSIRHTGVSNDQYESITENGKLDVQYAQIAKKPTVSLNEHGNGDLSAMYHNPLVVKSADKDKTDGIDGVKNNVAPKSPLERVDSDTLMVENSVYCSQDSLPNDGVYTEAEDWADKGSAEQKPPLATADVYVEAHDWGEKNGVKKNGVKNNRDPSPGAGVYIEALGWENDKGTLSVTDESEDVDSTKPQYELAQDFSDRKHSDRSEDDSLDGDKKGRGIIRQDSNTLIKENSIYQRYRLCSK